MFSACQGLSGLPVLAVVVTAGHFLIVLCFTPFEARIARSDRVPGRLRVDFTAGTVALSDLVARCGGLGFAVVKLTSGRRPGHRDGPETVRVHLTVRGKSPITDLAAALSDVDGVRGVSAWVPTMVASHPWGQGQAGQGGAGAPGGSEGPFPHDEAWRSMTGASGPDEGGDADGAHDRACDETRWRTGRRAACGNCRFRPLVPRRWGTGRRPTAPE